jgi:hypothetical protein
LKNAEKLAEKLRQRKIDVNSWKMIIIK